MWPKWWKSDHNRAGVEGEVALDLERMPKHLAIIMDGNGRWATRRGMPRAAGHRAGVESLRTVVESCVELGIGVLTVYAFSTENWKRPRDEVNALMDLLVEYLQKEVRDLHQKGVQIRTIGRIDDLPPAAREELKRAMALTRENDRLILNLALNYGGRLEIVDAVRQLARQVAAGELQPDEIDEELISNHLYTAGLPDPDLLIRPSGEMRLSNYLLWQSAYTELWVTPVLWPDFGRQDLLEALGAFQKRDRRFGGVKL